MSALDELRFGSQRTLNLREDLPSAAEAAQRAERWLKEHQVRGSEEVLIITGRGNQSLGGIAVLRPAIEKLLFSLRRRGVVLSHSDHGPGAFTIRLAPMRAVVNAPKRKRETTRSEVAVAYHGMSAPAADLLRQLAERSLHSLGVAANERAIAEEMHRYLRVIVPALRPTSNDEAADAQLVRALRAALAEFD